MNLLMTSNTGKVGTEVTKLLALRGIVPRGMTRDFERPETWEGHLKGIDKVCLITPPIHDEGRLAAMFAKKAYAMGVKQIVFLGIHNVNTAPHIPHFEAKIRVGRVLKDSCKPFTVIECNNFFQNDMYFLSGAKEQGMYLQPIGNIGLSRIDVRDIAEAIVNALTDEKHFYQSYPLVGGEQLTGEKTAKIMSEVFQKDIVYPENCMAIWEKMMKNSIPDWLLADWKMMYQHFIANGLKATPGDLIQQEKILGKAPRKYDNYLKELL